MCPSALGLSRRRGPLRQQPQRWQRDEAPHQPGAPPARCPTSPVPHQPGATSGWAARCGSPREALAPGGDRERRLEDGQGAADLEVIEGGVRRVGNVDWVEHGAHDEQVPEAEHDRERRQEPAVAAAVRGARCGARARCGGRRECGGRRGAGGVRGAVHVRGAVRERGA
eukprot:3148066-Prymnesium_polylepis.1